MNNETKTSDQDPIIFEMGKDPGEGQLRIVADLDKVKKNEAKRDITFRELYEVVFGKGTSLLLQEYIEKWVYNDKNFEEKQFRVIGLTNEGRPLIVVLAPRDEYGLAKRVVTAWSPSLDSKEVLKLLKELPHLASKIAK